MKPFLIGLACASALLTGCVTGTRLDWPAAQAGPARLSGFPETVRTAGQGRTEFETTFSDLIGKVRESSTDGSFDLLALSGGGAGGVFGAGSLVGLTRSGKRPQFEVVTGVSTGSLIAPFAFLGPDWDDELEESYTGGKSQRLLESGGIASLFRVGVFTSEALHELVDGFVTPELVAAVAAEAAKGRILIVATTHLDTEQTVYWDMGAIASTGGEKARELFVKVLVASASIPGAFPPVMFSVEGEAGPYDEMHVDGSVTVPFFVMPQIAFLSGATLEPLKGANIYVIVNGQIDSQPTSTPLNTISILLRSSNVLTMRLAQSELLLAAAYSRLQGMNFRFTFLPKDYVFGGSMDFETAAMRKLFDYAAACAQAGQVWIDSELVLEKSDQAPGAVARDAAAPTVCPAAP